MNRVGQAYFPPDLFSSSFADMTSTPLVVSPRVEMDLLAWARKNQLHLAKAIKEYGAIVFSGFSLTEERFPDAFTAITGKRPEVYKGDTPRDQVDTEKNVYKSTAVADSHDIPPHQEVSGGARKEMPKYISFFCVTPPLPGTGRTEVANVDRITEDVKNLMPAFWAQLITKKLTYISRYLPENDWRTKWIRWLNPSHALIKKRFGTDNSHEVEAICKKEGLTCEWDGSWAVISRKGVPGTITIDGKMVLCNQISNDKLNPTLCEGWLWYILARTVLYQTSRSMQFDVKFDDGTEISQETASQLLTIFHRHREGRDWKHGDLMVVHNATTMHAKTPHSGFRKIVVCMGGSVLEDVEGTDEV